MTTDYVPIDCDQHSLLELLAMRRAGVVVQAREAGQATVSAEGVVCDLLTRGGAEYLVLRDPAGEELSIRLDHLLRVSSSDGGLLWRQKNVAGRY